MSLASQGSSPVACTLVSAGRAPIEEIVLISITTLGAVFGGVAQVNISDIQGPLRSIWAERRWLVADLKKQLEKSRSDPRDRIWVGLKVW